MWPAWMSCSQGPQYVCTNFSTFVCTACSGIQLSTGTKTWKLSLVPSLNQIEGTAGYEYIMERPRHASSHVVYRTASHSERLGCSTYITLPLPVLYCPCSREFSHRIKSVSMAKFTSEEVANLQAGGNEVTIMRWNGCSSAHFPLDM